MRTIGVTAGASEPDCTSWRRFSMNWSDSRSARASQGLCSISNTTPSYFETLMASAESTSAGAKAVKVACPCSSARMMPLRRGSSLMDLLAPFARSGRGLALLLEYCIEPTEHAARVALEDAGAVGVAQLELVDVALGIVEVMPGVWVDALDGTDHLGSEQDVLDRHDLGQQLDTRQVIDAGVEEHVLEQVFLERRPLHVEREPAIATPVIGHRAAAMRNDELERREILEQVRRQELHEGGCVAIDVVRAGGVESWVAGGAHVYHRRHIQLHHLLVDRIP